MNILYILGNGFDINYGIQTSYLDFYKYYEGISTRSELVKSLKSEISSNIETWANLELALGKYVSKFKNINELDEVYDNLQENLIEYLTSQEQIAENEISKIKQRDFFADLIYPEKHLGLQGNIIETYKNKWDAADWNVNIVTLNYTRTAEKLSNFLGSKIEIGTRKNNSVFLNDIFHIHGTLDNQMILGVNDISQIANPTLLKDTNILDTLIKRKRNQAYINENNSTFERYIREADLICIYGSSLGWTDRVWWQQIGHRLQNECRLILFGRGPKYSNQYSYKYMRTANGLKNHFLSMLVADDSFKTKARNKIITGIRTNIFNLKE